MKTFLSTYRADIRETFTLSLPIIIGQLGNILMGVFDNAMVGAIEPVEYGAVAVAAAGVSNAVYFLVTVLGIGIMMAVSALVSISKAQSDEKACAEYLKYTMVAAFIITVFITAILLVVANNFSIFHQKPEVETLAKEYLYIIIVGIFPFLAGFGLKNFTDGLSYTIPAMAITLTGVCLNAFLNWLFIYGNWGFEAYGLAGAGYATVLSRIFIFVAMLVYIFKANIIAPYRRLTKGISLSSPYLKEIFKIGIPSGLQYFFEIGAFAAANVMTGWIGTFQSAAHQIALNLAAIAYMASTGISAAGGIRVGTAFGNKDKAGMKRAGYTALLMVVALMAVTATVFFSMNTELPVWFNKHPDVMYYTSTLLVIAALFQFSDGVQAVGLGILRGTKDVTWPTVITLVAYWVVGLPLAYFFAFWRDMGIEGIWYGLTIGLTVSAVMLTWRFVHLSSRAV